MWSTGTGKTIIKGGGANIHIFLFGLINFFFSIWHRYMNICPSLNHLWNSPSELGIWRGIDLGAYILSGATRLRTLIDVGDGSSQGRARCYQQLRKKVGIMCGYTFIRTIFQVLINLSFLKTIGIRDNSVFNNTDNFSLLQTKIPWYLWSYISGIMCQK